MATNTILLRQGLIEYSSTLEAHSFSLNENFSGLTQTFSSLNQAYEGQAAEVFKNSWLATAEWFHQYINETSLLANFLKQRVAALENEV